MAEELKANIRWERITRLLRELEHEVVRGMMEREIDESIGFEFVVPISSQIPGGVVSCQFRTRPMPAHAYRMDRPAGPPRLRVIEGDRN